MSERAGTPFHCPFCGETDLWPHEATHGSWECRACLRAFQLKSLGQISRPENTRPEISRNVTKEAHA